MSFIKKVLHHWQKISLAGIDESTSFPDSRRIILFNQITCVFFLSSLISVCLPFHSTLAANLIQGVEAICCLIAIYLNHKKKYIGARVLIVTATSIPLFLSASYYGREAGSQIGYLAIIIFVIVVNDVNYKLVFLYSCLLPVCSMVALEWTDYSLLKSYNHTFASQSALASAPFWFTLVCAILIVFYLLNIIEKQQKEIEEKEQKRSESEIQKREQDLQAVVTSLDDIVFLLDEEYVFLNVWTKDESKLFLSKEQFLGKPMKEVFEEPFYLPFKASIDQALATGQSQSLEYPSATEEGVWYKATVHLIGTSNGEKRRVSLITKDITIQKREEKTAKENFELFRLLAENLPAGMLIIQTDHNVLFANDHICATMRMKKENVVGHSCLQFYKNPQDHFDIVAAVERDGFVMNVESVGIRGDGTESQGLLSGTIATYLGEPVFLGFAVDITELKQALDAVEEKDRLLVESKLAALRAQMNPHFIFNAINSIQQLVLSGSREIAYDYFSKFSSLVRNILDHSDKLLIPLEDELHSLRLYIEIEALRFDDKFEYSIEVDPTLINTGCKIPPLLFQPFVENAIWHGLLHKPADRKLKIMLREEASQDLLYCIIEDNGIGRKKSIEMKEKEISTHVSKGIEVTLERMKLLNNIHDNITDFKITDLYDSIENATGTRVEFVITLQ